MKGTVGALLLSNMLGMLSHVLGMLSHVMGMLSHVLGMLSHVWRHSSLRALHCCRLAHQSVNALQSVH